MISAMPSVGSPTEVRTMDRVTRPTLGTPAVPIEAIVAVAMTVAMAAVRGISGHAVCVHPVESF